MFLTEKVNIFFRNVNKTINIFHGDTVFFVFFLVLVTGHFAH